MTMARAKKIFNMCVACLYLTFRSIFLVIAFFRAIRLLMGVMTTSFDYQLFYTNVFGIRKLVSLQSFYFKS